jgi:hypothetical protein
MSPASPRRLHRGHDSASPREISWRPGYVSPATGKLEFGGWIWRYDLTRPGPDKTKVTLSYD